MKIALLGATGFVGSALLNEALDRGHEVTAIVRHPGKLETRERLVAKGCPGGEVAVAEGIDEEPTPDRAAPGFGLWNGGLSDPRATSSGRAALARPGSRELNHRRSSWDDETAMPRPALLAAFLVDRKQCVSAHPAYDFVETALSSAEEPADLEGLNHWEYARHGHQRIRSPQPGKAPWAGQASDAGRAGHAGEAGCKRETDA